MEEVLTETERTRRLYAAACWAGQSSTEGRTFEEWNDRVSDYGLDDAEQALPDYIQHLRNQVVDALLACRNQSGSSWERLQPSGAYGAQVCGAWADMNMKLDALIDFESQHVTETK